MRDLALEVIQALFHSSLETGRVGKQKFQLSLGSRFCRKLAFSLSFFLLCGGWSLAFAQRISPRQFTDLKGIYNVVDFGAKGDGSSDDWEAVQTTITIASNNGGGVIYFPPGTYLIRGQLTFPRDNNSPPQQRSLRLMGAGPGHNPLYVTGRSGAEVSPQGGSILDLRYAGTVAKIDTRGLGFLEIDHLTLKDDGSSTTPFIQTTNTTLHIHKVAFFGNPAKEGAACDQDAIVLGGTAIDTEVPPGDVNAPFQGYGTIIEGNFFDRIRRGVFLRTYANGNVIRDNTWWRHCGSNLAGGAALESVGHVTNYNAGNYIGGNLIEVSGYVYGIKLEYSLHTVLVGNNFYDPLPRTVAYVRFEANAPFNTVLEGFGDDSKLGVSDVTRTNTIITSHQGQTTVFTQPVKFPNTATFSNGSVGPVIESASGAQFYEQFSGLQQLSLQYKPAAGAAESVAAWSRASATDKRLQLLGTTNSVLESPESQLRVHAKAGEALFLGDPANYVYVINGTLYSTRSTGTPPFSVLSTTPVPNLTVQRGEQFVIGDGAPISRHLSATVNWNPPPILQDAVASTTVTVAGAAVGDTVAVGFSSSVPGGALLVGAVTSANTVTVTLLNKTGGTLTLPAGTLRADVWKH